MAPEPPFARVLVANRGEIAIRVIRACRELGIRPIAVHSDADADALHVRAADHAERIGPPPASESYLSIEAILDAARRSGAEAIHPGYGFLSENAAFAEAVEAAGLVFIGPPASALEALGNKLAARRSAAAAGVPIVPGTTVALEADTSAVAEIGLPVMLKAAAGGGGRGMRRVDRLDDLPEAMAAARREAAAAFGDGTIYVERLVSPARHVEVQLLGDRHGGLAVLGERDCSVQRRHQKLVEESPSPAIDDRAREALFQSARLVAGTVDFHNAATVEFLVDEDRNHYFLEMNTRLQVEHGVTEQVTGLDLVAWQIRVAAGERLPSSVLEAPRRGHSIEVRIYAEDPYDGFRPTSGRVTAWRMPEGPGVRVDAGMEADTDLRTEYDPLLAKLMVHADDRPAAIARLRRALDETLIGGLQTDAGFLRWLVDEPSFVGGDYDTGFIDRVWRDGPALSSEEREMVAAAAVAARATPETAPAPTSSAPTGSAWGQLARREGLRR
ncbi:MAG TPA: biotin carboxylase N-terminal domain-containing protein [Patescibacteria group bacterium]|nr:biotin carboxylase N-terminal domain-containing protein [Patescibacteria group bacterium]